MEDDEVHSTIPHILQESHWDCGLACVAMIANALDAKLSLAEVRMHCQVESVWTIDLAYLLRKLSNDALDCYQSQLQQTPPTSAKDRNGGEDAKRRVSMAMVPMLTPKIHEEGWDFTYYTSTMGANNSHSKEKFYKKSFDDDQKRVNKLFDNATPANIRVIKLILPLNDFKRFLYCGKFGIIALVNKRLLKCQKCLARASMCSCNIGTLGSALERMKGYKYIGHFIMLISYEPTEDVFFYRDPAIQDNLCMISADDFDRARNSPGTDNDCVVVKIA